MPDSVREAYDTLGVEGWYAAEGAAYRNPHEDAVVRALDAAVDAWRPDLSAVLDLACGSGEVTLALRARGAGRIDGVDPFTGPAFRERTGQEAEALTFADVAAGALEGRSWSLVVCSYALHLAEPSRLPGVAFALARVAPELWVLTPHKRPELRWAWRLVDERVVDRVRARRYRAAP